MTPGKIKTQPPLRLFKYCPPERVDILTNGRIRFTPPNEFNDPFELLPRFSTSFVEKKLREFLETEYAFIVPEKKVSWKRFQKNIGPVAAPGTKEHSSAMMKLRRQLSASVQKGIADLMGILCLAELQTSLLMWAHYARDHTGFVLEFDTTHDFFRTPAALGRVTYGVERPVFEPNPPMHESFIETTWHKADEWKYEQEWRLIRYGSDLAKGNPSHLIPIPKTVLTGVYFGVRCDDHTRESIFEGIKRNCSAEVKFYQASLEQERYALEFEPCSNPHA